MAAENGTLVGRVAAVNTVPLGGILDTDAPAGSTVLFLEDTADFSEDGGFGSLIGGAGAEDVSELVTYLSADDDMGTLTLSAPTVTAFLAGDRVDLWDPSTGAPVVETRAQVLVDGSDQGGDPVEAVVDHTMVPYLPEGIRAIDPVTGVTGESVTLEWRGEELYVVNIQGRVPVMDGGMIDPGTLPEPSPPSEPVTPPAPTVIPGIGSLMVRWDGIAHPNPVMYEVYVSDVTPVVPSSETLVSELVGTAATIRRLPKPDPVSETEETLLRYDTIYYVAIRAKDSVDESFMSALSAESQGTPVQISSDDIAAHTVMAEHIVGKSIAGEQLAGEIVLGSTIKTAVAGQRVVIDTSGIRLISSDDSVKVAIPSDDGEDARFRGSVEADGLVVRQGATFFSSQNEFARDSVINLAESVAGPSVGPGVDKVWSGVELEVSSRSGPLGEFSLDPTNIAAIGMDYFDTSKFYVVQRRWGNGSRIWHYTFGTGALDVAAPFEDKPGWEIVGFSRTAGNHSVYLGRRHSDGEWWLFNGDVSITKWTRYDQPDREFPPKFAYNGTDMLIAEKKFSDSGQRLRRVAMPAGGGGSYTLVENVNPSGPNALADDIAFVYRGNADFGSTKWIVSYEGTGNFRVFDTAGNYQGEHNWPSPAPKSGALWRTADSSFYTLGSDGVLYKHTSLTWTDPVMDTWHAGFSFYDSNAAGTGTHETELGEVTSFEMFKRAQVRIGIPDVPTGDGGVDDPNNSRLYMKRGAAPNASRSDMFLTLNLPAGSVAYTRGTYPPTSGTIPKTVSTFPAGDPAILRSARALVSDSTKPVIEIKGDGSARLGPIEIASSGAFATSWDTGWITVAPINGWSVVNDGLGNPLSIQFRRIGPEVKIRGRITKASGSAREFAAIPSGMIPLRDGPSPTYDNEASSFFVVTALPTGFMQSPGSPAGRNLTLLGGWFVD